MHPTERKWQTGMEKVNYAKKLLDLLQNEDSDRIVATVSEPSLGLEIQIFNNHKINVSKFPVGRDTLHWASAAIRLIEPHLGDVYVRHFQSFHSIEQDDFDARSKARLSNIMGAIANNLNDIPELKQELILLGKMLEAGRDIKSYCESFSKEK